MGFKYYFNGKVCKNYDDWENKIRKKEVITKTDTEKLELHADELQQDN